MAKISVITLQSLIQASIFWLSTSTWCLRLKTGTCSSPIDLKYICSNLKFLFSSLSARFGPWWQPLQIAQRGWRWRLQHPNHSPCRLTLEVKLSSGVSGLPGGGRGSGTKFLLEGFRADDNCIPKDEGGNGETSHVLYRYTQILSGATTSFGYVGILAHIKKDY